MKIRTIAMLVVALLAAKTASQSLAADPFSTRSRAPVQQSPTAPSAPPYVKQETPAPQGPAQRVSPTAPLTKQPDPAVQKNIEEAKLVSVQAGAPQLISWGYLRAYEPETLGRMLSDVNAGRLPRTAVAGVVPPAQLDLLLKNAAQSPNVTAATQGLPPRATGQKTNPRLEGTGLNRDVIGTAKSGPPAWEPALRSMPLRTTPDRLEFGTLMLGQVQYKTVRFIAPQNGEVRVSITDPAFQIRRLRSLNGTFSTQTVPVATATGATIQSVNAIADASQQRTAAPWTIPVRSGEDVEITIDVSRSPSVALGEHPAELRIDLTNSLGAIVPVHARLDGRLYGIGIHVDGDFRALPGRDFMLPFEWLNDGEPGEATLTLDNLPLGFTTPTLVQTVKLGKGERRQGAFVINVSNALLKNNYEFATLNLKVANGPIRMTYSINVTVVPLWFKTSVNARSRFDDGDEVSISGFIQIRSDGWFQFEGRITSSSLGGMVATKIYRYDVGISLPAGFNHTVHGSFGRGTDLGGIASTEGRWIESGVNMSLGTNFLDNSRGLGYAASNPYIKVTKSAF